MPCSSAYSNMATWPQTIGINENGAIFSGSGTSPGSRERETDYEVRGVQPQPKIAHNRGSAQPVVAPEAGTTKDRCGSQSLAPLAQSE